MNIPVRSFTLLFDSRISVIHTPVEISSAYNPASDSRPDHKQYNAVWDTGATNTVITRKVVGDLNLAPISMALVNHAGGQSTQPVFLVNVLLPNNVGFAHIRVTEGQITDQADVLIGMDIINHGDFAITHKFGKTKFTFRIPSIEDIDFVETNKSKASEQKKKLKKIGRNDPCYCGSGKKFKKCCGK